jgi:hypothetical protein
MVASNGYAGIARNNSTAKNSTFTRPSGGFFLGDSGLIRTDYNFWEPIFAQNG